MTGNPKQLLDEALRLTVTERAELAARLLASLDNEPNADVDAAWAAEIERRIERMKAGSTTGRSWEDAEAELRQRHFPNA